MQIRLGLYNVFNELGRSFVKYYTCDDEGEGILRIALKRFFRCVFIARVITLLRLFFFRCSHRMLARAQRGKIPKCTRARSGSSSQVRAYFPCNNILHYPDVGGYSRKIWVFSVDIVHVFFNKVRVISVFFFRIFNDEVHKSIKPSRGNMIQ